jgi:hypothetical protein
MELKGLPGGDAQRFAAMSASEFVKLQPLRRRADAAGQSDPDHELKGRLEFLAPAFVAQIAIVLLLVAVKLH